MRRSLLAIALSAALLTVPLATYAQTPDATAVATRRALLDDAQQARDRGDHAHALQSALAASRIEMSASVALFIAEEQQTLGQTAHAFETAQRCSSLAENNVGIPNRAAILARCRELTDQLRARVALVTLQFSTPPDSDTRVTINQQTVSQPGSAPVAVEPGTVVVEASRPGSTPFHRELSIAPGGSSTVDVALAPTTTAGSGAAASAAPTTSNQTSAGPGPGPYVFAAVGAAGLIAAIPFFLVRQNALGGCTTDPATSVLACTQSQYDTANTFNTLTNVAWIAGSVVLAAGVAWWVVARVTSHSNSHEHASRRLVPLATFLPEGGVAVGLGGTL